MSQDKTKERGFLDEVLLEEANLIDGIKFPSILWTFEKFSLN